MQKEKREKKDIFHKTLKIKCFSNVHPKQDPLGFYLIFHKFHIYFTRYDYLNLIKDRRWSAFNKRRNTIKTTL